jgi:uncharacterized protein YegL
MTTTYEECIDCDYYIQEEFPMTDSSYVHYVLIIDRSGSMNSIQQETQNGIKVFVEDQRKLTGIKATLSLYQFDHQHDKVHSFTKLADVPAYHLYPRGSTALLDAIGFALTQEGEHLSAMIETSRPGKVIVVIATDGQENFSKEYTRDQIKKMITTQQDQYGWQFTYIGANQDSFAEARSIGLHYNTVMDYNATTRGTQSAWRGVSGQSVSYAAGASAGFDYTPEERTAAKDNAP